MNADSKKQTPPFQGWDVAIFKSYPQGDQIRGREREKGIHTKMRVKLAAKLLIIAWTIMKKREPFDPKYLNQKAA